MHLLYPPPHTLDWNRGVDSTPFTNLPTSRFTCGVESGDSLLTSSLLPDLPVGLNLVTPYPLPPPYSQVYQWGWIWWLSIPRFTCGVESGDSLLTSSLLPDLPVGLNLVTLNSQVCLWGRIWWLPTPLLPTPLLPTPRFTCGVESGDSLLPSSLLPGLPVG